MRVTIDLDNPSCLQILKAYYNLRHATGTNPEIRDSSTKGVHVRVSSDGSFEDVALLRDILGDDINRLDLDVARYNTSRSNACSVLWSKKNNKKSGQWMSGHESVERIIQLTHPLADGLY